MTSKNEIVIYQADELTKVEVQIDEETVWLSQEQMASLFGRNRVAITQHIGNIFKEGELQKEVVCKDFLLTTHHGAIKGKSQTAKVQPFTILEPALKTLERNGLHLPELKVLPKTLCIN